MSAPESGAGVLEVPIFPLPNVVFFPCTALPLHIFEPRYRVMVQDRLAKPGPIGIVLLRRPWESPESSGDDVYSIGGAGEIFQHEPLNDGKYDILLRGQWRFRILEFTRMEPYRTARVQKLPDPAGDLSRVPLLTKELKKDFSAWIGGTRAEVDLSILDQLEFDALVNTISSYIGVSDSTKQRLLEHETLTSRAEDTLRILRRLCSQQEILGQFRHLYPKDPGVN